MERSFYDMTLELQDDYSCNAVTVKRGDTHRTLRFRLSDGGRPYTPADGCKAVFTAVKPDGTHLYNTCLLEKDVIFYDLTPQTTAVPGDLACELRLYGEKGELLTTAAFQMTVADTVYADGDEGVASSGEATALTKLVNRAEENVSQMEQLLKKYELIEDFTLEEAAAKIIRNTDLNGVKYNFTALRIAVAAASAEAIGRIIFRVTTPTNYSPGYLDVSNALRTENYIQRTAYEVCNNKGMVDQYGFTGQDGANGDRQSKLDFFFKEWRDNISYVELTARNTTFPAGTQIKIFAIRG